MAATDITARLERARGHLERIFQILIAPSARALDESQLLLAAAVEELESSRPFWHQAQGDTAARKEALRVRAALGQAQRLLETAADFHRRWRRFLGARTGGYTCRGDPAQLPAQCRISLEA